MAKTLDELKNIRQQMIINLHTDNIASGYVADYMEQSAWTGEVAVQHFADDNAALWTLGKDNATAVEFISRKTIEGLLASAATLSIVSASPISANVQEEWVLKNLATGVECGEHIKIYKDQNVVSAKIGHMDDTINPNTGVITDGTGDTALVLTKLNASGFYETIKANIEDFVQEHEFKSGVTHTGHIVHGVVAPKTEPYLFVDADGFYLSGVSAMCAMEIVSAATTDTKVKEAWKLYNSELGKQYGEIINIYKDQTIESAYTGHVDDTIDATTGVIKPGSGETGFNLVKLDENGEYQLINVNMQQFIEENEIGHGLEMSGHTLVGKVAPFSAKSNDDFLYVDDDGFYTSGITEALSMEIVSAATSDVTVKEAWKLYNSALTKQYGEIINIYKDQHVVEAMIGKSGATVDVEGKITDGTLENTVFLISRMNASGDSELIEIDMQQFIEEDEVGSGLTVVDNVLRGVVAPKGDPYMFVDDEGFYLSGLSNLVCVISGETKAEAIAKADRLGHVTVESAQTGDHITYTIDGYDVAASSVVGSGWVSSSITEVIVEDERIVSKALNDLNLRISALTPSSNDETIVITRSSAGTDYSVNIDEITIGKDANGVLSTLLMIASANPSTANILEEWRLVDKDYNDVSDSSHIKIYKDSSLIEVYLGKTDDTIDPVTGVITHGASGATALCFKYQLADGKYKLVAIDVTLFFSEEIFKKGFEIEIDKTTSAHSINVKIDEHSEPYLTVSMDGLKLSGVSAISEFEVVTAATTDTTVKEAWMIYNSILNKQYGEIINIYKDQRIESAFTGHMDDTINPITGDYTYGTGNTALILTKLNASGLYETLKVDIEDFIQEHEFESGVTVDNHIVHGVVAPKTDPYLYVDADGFFLSGISAIANIVSGETEAEAIAAADRLGHVVVESAQTGDHVTYTIKRYDIASNEVLMELSAATIESADTLYRMIISASPVSSGNTILVGKPTSAGTNIEVNIDNKTIGKDVNGVLGTLLLISAISPSIGVKDEYALMDGDGNEISGSTHIKIYQNCEVSGETMADAIAAADRLGHVVVDSAMTSAGTVIYTIDRYDIAASSVVGSGWVSSSITEVIIENEKVVATALNDLNDRICNMNYVDSAVTNWYVDEVNQASGVVSTHRVQLPVVEVKNLYASGDTKSANVEILTDSASTVTVDFSKIIIDCGLY